MDETKGLVILGVQQFSRSVSVDMYGGESNACANVTIKFADSLEATSAFNTLDGWANKSLPVTLQRADDGQVTIVREV